MRLVKLIFITAMVFSFCMIAYMKGYYDGLRNKSVVKMIEVDPLRRGGIDGLY